MIKSTWYPRLFRKFSSYFATYILTEPHSLANVVSAVCRVTHEHVRDDNLLLEIDIHVLFSEENNINLDPVWP